MEGCEDKKSSTFEKCKSLYSPAVIFPLPFTLKLEKHNKGKSHFDPNIQHDSTETVL